MSRRSRSGRRSRSCRHTGWLALAAVALLLAAALPAASYTTGTADRSAAADVVADGEAVLGLDVAASVTAGETNRLVTATNRFPGGAEVTVALENCQSDADLVLDGANVGDSVSFALGSAASQRVDVQVANGNSACGGNDLAFGVRIAVGDATGEAPGRTVSVTTGNGNGQAALAERTPGGASP